MFDRLEFFFTEAIIALRRNTWMTFAAVTTAAMALYLIGGLAMAFVRLNGWLDSVKRDYQIRVFLKEGMTPESVASARKVLEGIPGVERIVFVPKAEGLKDFAQRNPSIDVSDLVRDNPLPDVFHVTLNDLEEAPRIAGVIGSKEFVEQPNGVKSSDDLRTSVEQIVRYSRILGISIAGIMLLTGGVLIYNSIRLTIVARRREIKIMELVGATKTTIRVPLLIEGTVHGLLGGLLAFLLLYLTVDLASRLLRSLDAMAPAQAMPGPEMLAVLLASGGLYGLFCSILAARNPRSEAA